MVARRSPASSSGSAIANPVLPKPKKQRCAPRSMGPAAYVSQLDPAGAFSLPHDLRRVLDARVYASAEAILRARSWGG